MLPRDVVRPIRRKPRLQGLTLRPEMHQEQEHTDDINTEDVKLTQYIPESKAPEVNNWSINPNGLFGVIMKRHTCKFIVKQLFAGLFFIVPCTDQFIRVDLRTVSFDIPPQEVSSHMVSLYSTLSLNSL